MVTVLPTKDIAAASGNRYRSATTAIAMAAAAAAAAYALNR